MINWLQNWYKSNCDGNWEHNDGIVIDTIDNPGWSVKIDIKDLDIFINAQEWKLFEISEENWVGYKIENNIFYGAGDPLRLNSIIIIFKTIIENGGIDDQFICDNLF